MAIATRGPVRVYNVSEVDLSGGVAVFTSGAKGIHRVSFQPVFAGYTTVTVKLQITLDGTNWFDVSGATTSTSGNVVTATILASQYRVHVTATLSIGTDTFELWVMEEASPI